LLGSRAAGLVLIILGWRWDISLAVSLGLAVVAGGVIVLLVVPRPPS